MLRRCMKKDLDQVFQIERICFKHPYDYSTFLYFLMREGLNFLSKRVDYMELQVKVSNIEAISFYRKLGFKEVGLIPNYYQDGEDALIMSKKV